MARRIRWEQHEQHGQYRQHGQYSPTYEENKSSLARSEFGLERSPSQNAKQARNYRDYSSGIGITDTGNRNSPSVGFFTPNASARSANPDGNGNGEYPRTSDVPEFDYAYGGDGAHGEEENCAVA